MAAPAPGPALPSIQTILGQMIAVKRPRAGDYFFFEYFLDSRIWAAAYTAANDGWTLHKSTRHPRSACRLNIRKNRFQAAVQQMLSFTTDGEFLKSGDRRIPVLIFDGPAITIGRLRIDHFITAIPARAEEYREEVELWREMAPPAPAPAPVVVPPLPLPVPKALVELEPLPRRIAWLVAEDAEKQQETCPISLDPISPITASVSTCFHSFDTEHLNTWLATQTGAAKCPMCRKTCVFARAFDDGGVPVVDLTAS